MAARDLVEQQRAEQLLRDAKLAADLAKQYGPAWERMRTEILRILAVVEKARTAGETVDTRWLLRKGYLDRLEKLVTFQTRTFLDFTARKVQESSVQAALDGQRDAAELVAEAAPGDVPKPLLETSYAVNNLAAGKPLRHLLDSLPGQVGSQAAGALLEGVVLGLGPREIARDIRKVATIPLTRALLISRTETLRVYRQAAFDRYRQSADVLTGWVWLAKLDDRTCPVCIALHGTRHELSEEMATHPACRCAAAPLTEPWTDPSLPDTRFAPQTGEAWFKNLPPDRQRKILGPGKFALYQTGELTLADLVQPTEHVVWGKGVRERALKELASPVTTPVTDNYVSARGTGSPEMAALREDFGANPSKYLSGDGIGGGDDQALAEIYRIQGFDGLPKLVSDEELTGIVGSDKGYVELWRGLSGTEDKTAAEMAEQFRTGSYYAGEGTWGNGTYTAMNPNVATAYSDNTDGSLVRMALRPDAKVAVGPEIRKQWLDAVGVEDNGKIAGQVAVAVAPSVGLDVDIGRYAAARGFDAINLDDGSGFYIVLNRTALVVARPK